MPSDRDVSPAQLLAEIAIATFERMRAAAQARRDAGKWRHEEAEARLMPWLSIALRAGADPTALDPSLDLQLDHYRAVCRTERCARVLLASDFCPREEADAELAATTRDALVRRTTHGDDLLVLADRLGVRVSLLPTQERSAA